MKIQAPKRILSEDFSKDDREVAAKLGGILNTYLDEVYQAISKRLTINDNLNQEIKTLTINVNADGSPKTKLSFKNNLSGKVQGMSVIRTFGNQLTVYQPFIDFYEASGVITINNIKGLSPNTDYQLVILIIGA